MGIRVSLAFVPPGGGEKRRERMGTDIQNICRIIIVVVVVVVIILTQRMPNYSLTTP